MNVLQAHLRISVETLLNNGIGQREIARKLGINRRTIRRIALDLGSKCSTCPPAFIGENALIDAGAPVMAPQVAARISISACEPHREWIEQQVRLGRNAVSIYQDLVDNLGFNNKYISVRRFVSGLKITAPERFDVLDFPPGEEAQVDYGQGAPTLMEKGKYKKPVLFVMTLKYSGKSFRKVVWKTGQEVWVHLHEEAFRSFGGCPQYVVLDNLKEGVIKAHIYEPTLNPVYAAMLAHYGVVGDPCRVRDPDRKGTVENAIQHTQNALKGRQFETIDAQNAHLRHWEENWASKRIHGRKKRQVMEMFLEEKPQLKPLPVEGFRVFKQVVRKVDDSGNVQVDGAYYSALPAALYSEVTVRIYERELEILDVTGKFVRRHLKAVRKGAFMMDESDRIFNPSRQNALLLVKVDRIGPHISKLAHSIFAKEGRTGAKVIYGFANLTNSFACADIDAVCQRMMANGCPSYAAVKKALDQLVAARAKAQPPPVELIQTDPRIRPLSDYQAFWESHSHSNREEDTDGYVPY